MGIRKSDGQPAVYNSERHERLSAKYPAIENGARGVIVPRHKFEVEKNPSRPFMFYPAAWGYVYGFPVSEDQVYLNHLESPQSV